MGATLAQRLDGVQRKSLSMRGESLQRAGETARKVFADPELAGRILAAALVHAGLRPKEAAEELGYADMGASISRWVAGVEPVQFARVVAHPEFRRGLAIALADYCEDMDVSTVITTRRKRAAR